MLNALRSASFGKPSSLIPQTLTEAIWGAYECSFFFLKLFFQVRKKEDRGSWFVCKIRVCLIHQLDTEVTNSFVNYNKVM